MKVLSIAVALAAILFVAYAFPQDYEGGEQPGEEGGEGEGEAGEQTTQNPCVQFDEQCHNNEDNVNHQNPNNTMGNTMQTVNPQCQALKEQCAQQNGGSTMPGGVTQPEQPQPTQPGAPTAPDMNNMTTPAPVPPNQNTTMPVVGIGRR